MATVLVLIAEKMRGKKTSRWFGRGCELAGDRVRKLAAADYREPCSDVLLHYGFDGDRGSSIARAHADYVAAGLKAVYVDLGYFKLRDPHYFPGHPPVDRYEDYQRFSINDRHPTAYFQKPQHPSDRMEELGLKIAPKFRQGRNVVVCGMSEKASRFDKVDGWTEAAIDTIRQHTDRPIVYRPKPQRRRKPQLPPIAGTIYSNPMTRSLWNELPEAWAVVSHHSNAGLDALVAGVPCFQPEGVASVLALADLSMIETPLLPTYEERRQLVSDVCYCQWNAAEIDAGIPWRHFKSEGLVP